MTIHKTMQQLFFIVLNQPIIKLLALICLYCGLEFIHKARANRCDEPNGLQLALAVTQRMTRAINGI